MVVGTRCVLKSIIISHQLVKSCKRSRQFGGSHPKLIETPRS
jgi:hypothetical protein